VRHGHYGVNLFFIVSGYVIFMTLHRTREPMDFVVSRFSRLYPAYWVAVGLTFAVTALLGLPGKEVSFGQALGNLLMFHGLLGVPDVDNVYWTLQVELLFYAGMFTVHAMGAQALSALADRLALQGVRVPWVVALSTRCRNEPAQGLRTAVQALVRSDRRFLSGPQDRSDGCHFSARGLQRAAGQWGAVLAAVQATQPAGR
jgi:peptidoglycan/LPS O-acetylase OafA/YrhL